MSTAASEPSPALEQPTTSITNSNSQLNPIAPSPQSENNSENASTQPPQPSQQTLTAPTSTSPSTKQTTPEPTSISPNEAIPADKVVLTFLLVSGKKKEGWVFNPSQTIGDIVKNVWEWWPKGGLYSLLVDTCQWVNVIAETTLVRKWIQQSAFERLDDK
ncbi:hypothetical protein BKA69DRAFT_1041534 [Paraphysoderma sedebokerense]|nr:hypothetical protein BKA69DRAFT_1041534 [Paraphysoderma sedebokerense]